MNKVKQIGSDIKSGWDRMEKPKRIRLGIIVGAIVILVILFGYFSQRTEYTVLFSELEEADAGAIVEDLEAKGMDYQLEDNGTTILIDEEYIDNYRINLAVEGLMPSNTTGFEIFDEASMMATDEDREIMYQRALAGELERAISSLDSIKAAKVLLSLPEESIFQNPDYQKEASASVVLELQTSQIPSQQTIQGIASLISGAVEHLPVSNVEIMDTNGNLLSTSLTNDGALSSADVVTQHQQITQSIETDLEQKVRSLLGPVYGLEKVQVSVNADLNFDAIEREEVAYGEPSVRSQTEHVSGSEALAGQVQGGNLEDGGAVFGEEDGEDNSTYEHTTNYELNTTTQNIVEAPGTIERITASVVILDNPVNQDAIQNLVENALGIVQLRENGAEDSVYIEFLPQITEDETPSLIDGDDFMGQIIQFVADYGFYMLGGFVLLLILILVIRGVRRRRMEAAYEDFDIEETTYNELLQDATKVDTDEERKKKEAESAHMKEDTVRKQAKENPELAAELIKIWMKEK